MPNKELKKLLDYCLNVKECSKCDYAKEEDCMLTCSVLIKECLNENYAEVVRCKDCKFSRPLDKSKSPEKYFKNSCVVCECETVVGDEPMIYINTHFCSYGERKE